MVKKEEDTGLFGKVKKVIDGVRDTVGDAIRTKDEAKKTGRDVSKEAKKKKDDLKR